MARRKTLERLQVLLTADEKGLAKPFDAAASRIDKFGKKVSRVGGRLSRNLTVPLAAVGAVSVKSFADFDSAMTQSLAIMGEVSDTLRNEMAAAAKDVARTTTLSARDAGEAYFFLASAGLDAQQSVAALPQVAAFAQAGMFDMARATDLATDAQSALGLASQDAQANLANMSRVTDVLVKANTLANASVEQFSTALTTEAGAALKSFGIDVEEGVAVLAAFADQGVKGEKAGAGLSRVLRLMSQAANNNKQELAALGIEIFDSEGEMRNLADIVASLEVALGDMSDQQRTAALESIGFTARVQGMILPLLGSSDAIREYEAGLRDAGGTTRDVADKQLTSFSSQMKLVRDNVELAAIQIGEVMAPFVERLGKGVARLSDFIGELNPTVLRWGVAIAGVAAALGPVLLAVGKLASLAAAAAPVLSALTGPIGLIAVGVGAAAVAFFKWREEITGFLAGALRPLRPVVESVFGVVKSFGALLLEIARVVLPPIAHLIGGVLVAGFKALGGAAKVVLALLEKTMVPVLRGIAKTLDFVTAAFRKVTGGASDTAKAVGRQLMPAVTGYDEMATAAVETTGELNTKLGETGTTATGAAAGVKSLTERLAEIDLASALRVNDFKSDTDRMRTMLEGLADVAEGPLASSIRAALDPAPATLFLAKLKPVKIDFEKLGIAAVDATQTIGEAFTDAARATTVGFERMALRAGGSVKKFVSDALRQFARLAASKVFKAIFSAVPGLGGILGGFFGGFFQHGGTLKLGQFGIVGEAGPEIAMATPRGTVIQPIGDGGGAREVVLRVDTTGMPPIPQPMTPDAVAVHRWYRELFDRLVIDGRDRGTL